MTEVTKPILLDETGQQMVGKMEEIIQALQAHGTTDHSQLSNLDYEHSGHTGFQPTISDLFDIRNGASAGATAYQKPSTGIPASDLASGVIPTVPTSLSQLSQDSSHRVVTDTEKSTWNAKGTYSKPSGGIPKTDLASDVQTSLGKADTALQSHQSLALAISSLTSNPSSITLNSTAARTYQTCTISSRTSITLSGGASNAGYEHYILFQNTGSSDCVITKASTMVGPSSITVKAGKYLEMSWIYTGSKVVITNSTEIG